VWLIHAATPSVTHQWPDLLGTGPLASEGLQDANATHPSWAHKFTLSAFVMSLGKYLRLWTTRHTDLCEQITQACVAVAMVNN
jgi:hypothetical protein